MYSYGDLGSVVHDHRSSVIMSTSRRTCAPYLYRYPRVLNQHRRRLGLDHSIVPSLDLDGTAIPSGGNALHTICVRAVGEKDRISGLRLSQGIRKAVHLIG